MSVIKEHKIIKEIKHSGYQPKWKSQLANISIIDDILSSVYSESITKMICHYSAAASSLGAELPGKRGCRREAPSRLPAQREAGVCRPGWDLGIWALQPQEMQLP